MEKMWVWFPAPVSGGSQLPMPPGIRLLLAFIVICMHVVNINLGKHVPDIYMHAYIKIFFNKKGRV